MGINERKERDKQEMRRNIIDAALEMFVKEGFEKTSIRNIAEKIEYSPATIYLYYKDKDELLYDVQAEGFEKLLKLFKKNIIATDPFERLKQLCLSYVDFGWKNKELYELMFIYKDPMNAVKDNEDWKNGEDAFSFLLDCVDCCMEAKALRFTDNNMAALSVWAMGHGLISLETCCRYKITGMDEEMIWKFVVNAITQYLELIKA